MARRMSADVTHKKKVRVLVIGDSGCGKTSMVRLIARGARAMRDEVERTAGCSVEVLTVVRRREDEGAGHQHHHGEEFFVELWDVGGHAQYKRERPIFYDQINGVIIVYDASIRASGARCEQWAREVALKGTFAAPMEPPPAQFASAESPSVMYGFGGLPVPCLIVANKVDLEQFGGRGQGAAQGILRGIIDKLFRRRAHAILPETIGDVNRVSTASRHQRRPSVSGSLPPGGGLRMSATHGFADTETIKAFFQELINRSLGGDGAAMNDSHATPYVTERILRPKDDDYDDLT